MGRHVLHIRLAFHTKSLRTKYTLKLTKKHEEPKKNNIKRVNVNFFGNL